jgi:hypothetical protein
MQYDSPSLHKEAFNGILKLKEVKRKFEEVDNEEPYNIITTESNDEERYPNTMKFVENYKSTRKRMSWYDCHAKIQQKTDIVKYNFPLLTKRSCQRNGKINSSKKTG